MMLGLLDLVLLLLQLELLGMEPLKLVLRVEQVDDRLVDELVELDLGAETPGPDHSPFGVEVMEVVEA